MSDWLEELTPKEREEWQAVVDNFRREALQKITQSQAFISLVPDPEDVDAKFAMELGAAIMLEKPLIVVAMPGVHIPPKLREFADHVIEADIDTEEGREQLASVIAGVIKEMP